MPPPLSERQHAIDRITAYNKRINDGADAQRERDDYVRALHAAGWTQVELAEAVGVSQQRISRIIKAHRATPG